MRGFGPDAMSAVRPTRVKLFDFFATVFRKTCICAPEDVLLLIIINNIHNLSFLFSG